MPAPRVSTQERPPHSQAPGRLSGGHSSDSTPSDSNAAAPTETTNLRRQADQVDTISKRVKPEKSPNASSITSSPSIDSGHSSPTTQLDPRTQLMLINRRSLSDDRGFSSHLALRSVLCTLQPPPADSAQNVLPRVSHARARPAILDSRHLRNRGPLCKGNREHRTHASTRGSTLLPRGSQLDVRRVWTAIERAHFGYSSIPVPS